MSRVLLNVARLVVAAAAIVAISYQFATLCSEVASFSPANFFSFFTIQTNLFAIAMLGLVVIVRPAERSVAFDAVRGAVTLYITTTGVVFALLLAGLQESLDTHIAWVDFTVHKLMPVVLVADWLIDPPRHRLSFRIGLAWLLYPLAYLAYTLIRGAQVDWYPYPFLDVSRHGYGGVLLNCAVMLLGFVAAAAAFVAVGNRRAADARLQPGVGRQSSSPISTESQSSPLWRRNCLTRRPSSTKPSLR